MLKNYKNSKALWGIVVYLLLLTPVFYYAYQTSAGFSYIATSFLYALPIVFVLMIVAPKRWIYTILLSLILVFSITDTFMVAMFDNYINAGNVLAVFTTTAGEGSHFIKDSMHYWWYIVPCVVLFVGALYLRRYATISWRVPVVGLIGSVLLMVGFVLIKVHYGYKDMITIKYFVDNRIWNRPPYNVPYQMVQAGLLQNQRKCIAESANMSFNAKNEHPSSGKSIYILAVGESCNYEHFSMNGIYDRETTPQLMHVSDAILYSNYYSTSCLTMWSVPQIVTRATPKEYGRNFKEKSIFKPFQECGYKTFFVVSKMNLLGYERYLSAGCDSLYNVDSDIQVIDVVDSLSALYDKVFFVVEFLGNHHPYYNYTSEYDVYHPNINSDANVSSDSLYHCCPLKN